MYILCTLCVHCTFCVHCVYIVHCVNIIHYVYIIQVSVYIIQVSVCIIQVSVCIIQVSASSAGFSLRAVISLIKIIIIRLEPKNITYFPGHSNKSSDKTTSCDSDGRFRARGDRVPETESSQQQYRSGREVREKH